MITCAPSIQTPAGSGAFSFAEPESPKPEYASFGRRLIAFALDYIFLATVTFVVQTLIYEQIDWNKAGPEVILASVWLTVGFYFTATIGYFTLMTAGKSGATIGKSLLGIKVICTETSEISYGKALVRTISSYLSAMFLYVGFLIAIIDKRNQTFHDKIAGTVVVEID